MDRPDTPRPGADDGSDSDSSLSIIPFQAAAARAPHRLDPLANLENQEMARVIRSIIVEELKCHICLSGFSPSTAPLFGCLRQHLVCSPCFSNNEYGKKAISVCPACRIKGPFLPARLITNIGRLLYDHGTKYCRNYRSCRVSFDDLEALCAHESVCRQGKRKCPGCKALFWKSALFEHVPECGKITSSIMSSAPLDGRGGVDDLTCTFAPFGDEAEGVRDKTVHRLVFLKELRRQVVVVAFIRSEDQGRKALLHVEAHSSEIGDPEQEVLPSVKLRVIDREGARELTFIPKTSDDKLCLREREIGPLLGVAALEMLLLEVTMRKDVVESMELK